MRPLSKDLRERVVAAVGSGDSCRSVAARFGVAASTVVKWSQRYRTTGSVAPGKVGGHRKPGAGPHRAFIQEQDRSDTAPDPAQAQGRAGGPGCVRLTQCGVDVPAPGRAELQKKHCSLLSRPGPTMALRRRRWQARRPASIRNAWSSSTRPGSRRT